MSRVRFGSSTSDPAAAEPPILRSHATLQAFDAGTYLASVLLERSPDSTLDNVPVSRGIAAAAMVPGRVVCLIVFDELNLADSMIVGVF
jgi:hypothetical protein